MSMTDCECDHNKVVYDDRPNGRSAGCPVCDLRDRLHDCERELEFEREKCGELRDEIERLKDVAK